MWTYTVDGDFRWGGKGHCSEVTSTTERNRKMNTGFLMRQGWMVLVTVIRGDTPGSCTGKSGRSGGVRSHTSGPQIPSGSDRGTREEGPLTPTRVGGTTMTVSTVNVRV